MSLNDHVIILSQSDLRFHYKKTEIIKFRMFWNEYRKNTTDTLTIINQLADDLGMTPDNVTLLALDQIRKRKIR